MTELNTERALIGMALASRRAYEDAEPIVDPADFADRRYGRLWALIGAIHAEGRDHNPLAVQAALKRIPAEDRRGIDGPELAAMYGDAPIGSAAFYARTIAGEATRRRLEEAGGRIVQLARGVDLDDLGGAIESARAEVDKAGKVVTDVKDFGGILLRYLDALEQPRTFIPTPWAHINELIGGWRPGAVYVIGARPGVGKSVLGIQAAVGISQHDRGGLVSLSSLEMSDEEVAGRIVAQEANVPYGHLKDHTLDKDDWSRIASAHNRMHSLRIYVDDKSTVTPLNVRAHARTVSRKGPLGGVIVDYLQLMVSPQGDRRPRHEMIADFSRQMKIMAKELNVPVILLSQLNRGSEQRQDKRPSIAELRESGAIEQDADVVMLLHSTEDRPDILEVGVAKNRHGKRGSASLKFEGAYQRATHNHWTPTHAIGSA